MSAQQSAILVTGWQARFVGLIVILYCLVLDHVLPNHGAAQSVGLIIGLLIKPDNEPLHYDEEMTVTAIW